MFRHQLLGILRDGQARHGYALVKEYERRTGAETNTGYAYRDLGKLIDEGLVETADKEQGVDRRRRPYRITDAGCACFDTWFSDVPSLDTGTDGDLAARAIFFEETDRDVVLDLLDRWRVELELLHRQIGQRIEFPRRKVAMVGALPMILRRRQRLVALEIDFLEDLRPGCGSSAEPIERQPAKAGGFEIARRPVFAAGN